jgi:hypothetical protein
MAGMRGVAASKPTGGLPTALPLARAIGASIANAPDRGGLLSYPNKAVPTKREGAYTWFPATISEAHALKGIATGEMTVPSPDGSQVKLRYERHVEEIDGNWTWIGRVVGGDPMQEAIITFGEKAVFGSIPQSNGKPALSLQTRNGSVFAVQTDPTKVVSATKGHADVMIPEAASLRSSMAAAVSQSAQVSQSATAVAQAAPPTGANTIDVAIGYTPEFAAANNGASGAATRLVYLVQVGNQAFSNSDINGYLRIVHAVQVSYTNTNTNQTALQELTGSTGNSPVTIPASLAPLRTARDQYGADIAVLVRKFNTPENEGCGIAWLNGANGPSRPGQPPITSADAAWGYAVISDGYDNGTDGKTYYCADETLVHEAAHLMGSAHDRANSMNGSSLQYGAYSYSFGYKTSAAAGNFYTVMAYGDTGQIAHRIFSTPLKSTCGSAGNLVCGVANSEDNARSLNQTIPLVAAFRATVVPFDNNPTMDLDGDGRSDIVLTHGATGSVYYWLMDGAGQRSGRASSVTLPGYTLRGTGDFNNDSRADLLFSNATTVRLLVGKTDGDFTNSLVADLPAGWVVGGVGDIDADGKSDIVLTHGATGSIYYWLMDGAAQRSGKASTVTLPGYTLRATGDFNGDGRADLLFSNATTVRLLVGKTDGDFTNSLVGELPPGWVVGGAGDIDGDGKADIVLTHGATGSVYYWLMDGAALRSGRASTVTLPGYTLRAIGDYNADGRADLLFSNATSVRVMLGKSDGDFTNSAVADLPPGWVLANLFGRLGGASYDIDADGKSDVVLTHASTGSVYYWLMDGAGQRSGRASSVTLPGYTLRGSGDFNADGRADLLYSNATTVRLLLGRTDGDFTNSAVAELPPGWTVGGVGDVDADGKADVVLTHAATGSIYYWLMDGAGQRSGRASTVTVPGYTLRAVADFNADGRADLLFSNATTVRLLLGRADGDFTNTLVADLPSGWTVGGAGDIDADGKSDIILTHAATGSIYYWLMDGAAQRSGRASTVALPGYTLRSVGDSNADGRADLLFSNSTTVRMLIGRTDGDFTNSIVADLPGGWVVGNR